MIYCIMFELADSIFYSLLQDMYYVSVKALYTVGYSTSLVSLTTAMVILCRFR